MCVCVYIHTHTHTHEYSCISNYKPNVKFTDLQHLKKKSEHTN